MNPRLLELAARRGELHAQCATQRAAVAANVAPVAALLGVADKAAAGVRWARANPLPMAAFALAFAIVRPGRMWRLGKRLFFLWRGWQGLTARLRP
jgi:hypothetical protein